MTHICRVCKVELTDENWYSSQQKNCAYICKECEREHQRLYVAENRDKINARQCLYLKNNPPKKTGLSMSENKECPSYLGVHVNERLLKHYFNDVVMMPFGNPGYDFVCNNGWKIDAKSSATGDKGRWKFLINHNTTADYFFCVAYDNRKDLNIIHIWMLPGNEFNHMSTASISKNTVHKWTKYEKPIDEMMMCCNDMKEY